MTFLMAEAATKSTIYIISQNTRTDNIFMISNTTIIWSMTEEKKHASDIIFITSLSPNCHTEST